MQSWKQWYLLGLILLVALALRWTGLDWDNYQHYHPDERYITWVASTIEWPADLRSAFEPSLSSLNPFYWYPEAESEGIEVLRDEPRDFAYGHLPLYMGVLATRLVERLAPAAQAMLPAHWLVTSDFFNGQAAIEFRHLTAVARALTGVVDAITVLLIFLLGRRLFGYPVGLLAAAFLALNVMHIQLAHFFTVDPYLAMFSLAALYFMVRAVYAGRPTLELNEDADRSRCTSLCNLLIAAVFVGLAIGAKFSAALLFLPMVAAVWLTRLRHRFWRFLALAIVVLLTFFVTNPFAILDLNCEVLSPALALGPLRVPALDWRSCYLSNIFAQGAMVRGQADLGFTRQYDGTWPYLYPLEMQLRWGMGWPLGLLAFGAFAWIIWITVRAIWQHWYANDDAPRGPLSAVTQGSIVLLIWAVPFFITTGSFYVKFMRYLQPLTPLLMLFAGAFVWQWASKWGRLAGATIVLVLTAVYALAFMNIYTTDHPWVEASRWVYANVPPGAVLASEQWDDSLPSTMKVGNRMRYRREYRDVQLTWLTGPDEADNEAKLQRNLAALEAADYVTLVSNRVYGVVPRLEARYEVSHVYHQLLFDGALGYEPVFVTTRMPGLAGVYLQPDSFVWPHLMPPAQVQDYLAGFPGINGGRFDESFTVYDQPLVMIFKNTGHKSALEMRQYFPET